jgi:hypothetical protein
MGFVHVDRGSGAILSGRANPIPAPIRTLITNSESHHWTEDKISRQNSKPVS